MESLHNKMPDKNDFSESKDSPRRLRMKATHFYQLLFWKIEVLQPLRYIETWISKINDGMNLSQYLNALVFSKVLNIQN